MKKILTLVILLLELLLVPAAGTASAQSFPPSFEASPCPAEADIEIAAECGFLITVEDYANPEGATVRLRVTIFRDRGDNPDSAPLVVIAGFPGETSDRFLPELAYSSLREGRDIVVLEQRGTSNSEPALDCEPALLADNARPCLLSLQEEGLTFQNYTTATMAADLGALRQALGYESWNLLAAGYSTRTAMLAVSAGLPGLRSVILDSTIPPSANIYETVSANYNRALTALFDACNASPACAAAYPDLPGLFTSLVGDLNANPAAVAFIDPATGDSTGTLVTGDWLLAQTYDALYGHLRMGEPLAYWPLFISQVAAGNTSLLSSWLTEPAIDWERRLTFGMFFVTLCQDEYAGVDPETLADQAMAYPWLESWAGKTLGRSVCQAWQLPASGPLSQRPASSDIPALLLSGTLDPLAPPSWGRETATSFSNAYVLEFPGMGNFVTLAGDCVQDIVAGFLDDPAEAPGADCPSTNPGAAIVLPDAIDTRPGIYRLSREIFSSDYNVTRRTALWATVGLFAAEIAFLGVLLIGRLWGGKLPGNHLPEGRPARNGWYLAIHGLATVMALLNLVFVLSLRRAVANLSVTEPAILRFGLPAAYSPLLLIPAVTEILTAVLLIITFAVWIGQTWSLQRRIFLSFVTTAGIIFSGLMTHWSLTLFG